MLIKNLSNKYLNKHIQTKALLKGTEQKIHFSSQLFKGSLRVKKQNNGIIYFKFYIISRLFVLIYLQIFVAIKSKEVRKKYY